jgi:hypothetical protein
MIGDMSQCTRFVCAGVENPRSKMTANWRRQEQFEEMRCQVYPEMAMEPGLNIYQLWL